MITKRYWSRFFKRISISCKKRLSPHDFKIGKAERDVMIIFNTLIHHNESELLMHPSGDKFYLKSPKMGIFLTISGNLSEISIINHVYGYNVKIGSRVLKNITSSFMEEVEKRRLQMEKEYNENIQHSLSNLAKTIKERI
jgi:hypothetical protein